MTPEIIEENIIVMTFSATTTMIRAFGRELNASHFDIEATLSVSEGTSQEDLSRIVVKYNYLINELLGNAIAFSYDNGDALEMLFDQTGRNRTKNILMITPFEPSDELLATLLQSKLNALGQGLIEVESCSVRTDNPAGLSFTFVGQGAEMLPDMSEWIGDRSYFAEPWWNRNDASLLDVLPPADADLAQKPAWAFDLDAVLAPKPETGVVVRPNFRPVVVDGGKNGHNP